MRTLITDRTAYSWDNLYTTELSNNTHNPEDKGTVWFDDSDAEAKILSYLASTDLPRDTTSFLDLGCGNGSLLFALREGGDEDEDEEDDEDETKDRWTGPMLGVDYSPQSIALANQIRSTKPSSSTSTPISFLEFDMLSSPPSTILTGAQSSGFDVILDKGTFDAISLSSELDSQGRRLNEGYKESMMRLMKTGGLFVITSCNWTEKELRDWFEGGGLVWEGRVEYRSFQFGGVKGQTITTLCFRREA